MRGARYLRLIPWTLRSGSEQKVQKFPNNFPFTIYIRIHIDIQQHIYIYDLIAVCWKIDNENRMQLKQV